MADRLVVVYGGPECPRCAAVASRLVRAGLDAVEVDIEAFLADAVAGDLPTAIEVRIALAMGNQVLPVVRSGDDFLAGAELDAWLGGLA